MYFNSVPNYKCSRKKYYILRSFLLFSKGHNTETNIQTFLFTYKTYSFFMQFFHYFCLHILLFNTCKLYFLYSNCKIAIHLLWESFFLWEKRKKIIFAKHDLVYLCYLVGEIQNLIQILSPFETEIQIMKNINISETFVYKEDISIISFQLIHYL